MKTKKTKEWILLLIVLIILIAAAIHFNNASITGAAIKQEEENAIIGQYSIMPSFRAKLNSNAEDDYRLLREKLSSIIAECKQETDLGSCINSKASELGWECLGEDSDILHDFTSKLQECINLEEKNVVCKFFFDDNDYANKRKNKRSFEIRLTSLYKKVKAELIENKKVAATEYIDLERLQYTDYNNKDSKSANAGLIAIKLDYVYGKPSIDEAYAVSGNSKIDLSKTFLLYKSDNGVNFIDESQQTGFEVASPANKMIELPKAQGFKFCAKTGNVVVKFAVKLSD